MTTAILNLLTEAWTCCLAEGPSGPFDRGRREAGSAGAWQIDA
jgi:hypothetical protein